MLKKSLLVLSGNENGFLAHSLCDNLTNNGMKNQSLTLDNWDLVKYCLEKCDLVILMEDINVEMFSGNLSKLKDACCEKKIPIALYANPEPIEKLKKLFPESIIEATFIRPIDVHTVLERIEKIFVDKEKHIIKKKVLVVDDSGAMLRTIMSWLEGTYQVMLANSAARAFTAIEKEKPDLILLDYEMPICSGVQFFEMLGAEEDTKNIPVIFLTARDDAETVRQVLELKPQGYILKTTPEKKVLKIISDFFAKQEN